MKERLEIRMRIAIEFEKGGRFIADMDEKKAPKHVLY
jgi:hypothetical protein